MLYEHIPVLLTEVLDCLQPQPGQNFVDATLGGGGYTRAILEKSSPDGKILAIDADKDALKNFQLQISSLPSGDNSQLQDRVITAHSNFRDIDKVLERHPIQPISGIVADLGLSSYQLDQSGRGITFQKKELLDMRFDQSETQDDAKFLLNEKSLDELSFIFKEYGEERFSYQIAK
jgi:16S rRNA (cytosine1402-N4)-methyltransferase